MPGLLTAVETQVLAGNALRYSGHGPRTRRPSFRVRGRRGSKRDYYVQIEDMPVFGPSLHSHLHTDGLVMLQIGGDLPKTDADRYGKVLEDEG